MLSQINAENAGGKWHNANRTYDGRTYIESQTAAPDTMRSSWISTAGYRYACDRVEFTTAKQAQSARTSTEEMVFIRDLWCYKLTLILGINFKEIGRQPGVTVRAHHL